MTTSGSIPCADYPVNPIPAQVGMVAHVNLNPKWWDTTTAPLPWNTYPLSPNTIPWVPTTGTITIGSYPTQEQKSEIVLAVLLNVLLGKSYVELMNKVVKDDERETIEFVYQDTGLLIRVPKNMRFVEIVNALYAEFGNLRGKQIQ